MAKINRVISDSTISKAKAASLLAVASILGASLGMGPAHAEDKDVMHNGSHYRGTGGGAGKVSNQYKEQVQKGNSSNQGRELNPQPLPPGMKQQ